MTSGPYAYVRNLQTSGGSNLKTIAQIKSAESHAKRKDRTSQDRQVEGRSHAGNYFWSKTGEGLEGGGADYVAAFKAHKKEAGARERKGAAIGHHILVGVSPEWLAETGDSRSLDNERVRALIDQAARPRSRSGKPMMSWPKSMRGQMRFKQCRTVGLNGPLRGSQNASRGASRKKRQEGSI